MSEPQSEQYGQFDPDDRQQINKARKEAEALFRPKPQFVEPSFSADPSPTDALVRKPKILSASPLPVARVIAEAPVPSKPPTTPEVSVSQSVQTYRTRLKGARAAIYKQQDELQAKLNGIDCELRAIDAYEAAKKGLTQRFDHRR